MPASRKSRAGIKAQNQASKQSWWVTNDAEPIDPPKKKKGKSKSRKRGKPARIKINHLCFFVKLLPEETQARVVESLKGANVGKPARRMTVRELDDSNYFAPPGAEITIRALLERLSKPDLAQLCAVADPESEFPADQPASLKTAAKVLRTQAREAKAPQASKETSGKSSTPPKRRPKQSAPPFRRISKKDVDTLVDETLGRYDDQ